MMTCASIILLLVVLSPSSSLAFVPSLRHRIHRCSSRISTEQFVATEEDGGETTHVQESRDSFPAGSASNAVIERIATTPSLNGSSGDSSNNNNCNKQLVLESLLGQAQQQLVSMKHENGPHNTGGGIGEEKGGGGAGAAAALFDTLAQAFQIDPTSSKVSGLFMEYLRWKVEVSEQRYYEWKKRLDLNEEDDDNVTILSEKDMNEFFQDRMGLSSLFIDREQYDMSGKQLRAAIDEATFWIKFSTLQNQQKQKQEEIEPLMASSSLCRDIHTDDYLLSSQFQHWQPQIDRARYLLYRTNAACCQWESYFEDGDRLRQSILRHHRNQHQPIIHGNGRSISSTSTRQSSSSGSEQLLPVQLLVHPFDALKFPCISLELASAIAKGYAHRALEAIGVITENVNENIEPQLPRAVVTVDRHENQRQRKIQPRDKKIRIGYISPDFTSRHPLAFLMQNVFACHDKSQFTVNIYSLSSPSSSSSSPACDEDDQELKAIRESSDQFIFLSPSSMSPLEMYQRILQDELDILVDLCGYAGTSVMSEIMASRCRLRQDEQPRFVNGRRFPIHVSYMGFPGSVGSSMIWDYSVFDQVVIPTKVEPAGCNFRRNYEEALLFMPHSYFVNSHKAVIGGKRDGIILTTEDERKTLRLKYGIPPSAFVYCCHSRPDKIDPTTFRSWMRALSRVWSVHQCDSSGNTNEDTMSIAPVDDNATCSVNSRAKPVLWMLRSGDEMEKNIRRLVREEFGKVIEEDCIVFADIVERREHLHRLGIADLFLDTPIYNAHTIGCDALYLGVPMVSLLRSDEGVYDTNSEAGWILEPADAEPSLNVGYRQDIRSIATNKLASRVGASLLYAVGLDELVQSDMVQYEDIMVRCALDNEWFDTLRQRLLSVKDSCPLFDEIRWIQNLEAAFASMVEQNFDGDNRPDIVVLDSVG